MSAYELIITIFIPLIIGIVLNETSKSKKWSIRVAIVSVIVVNGCFLITNYNFLSTKPITAIEISSEGLEKYVELNGIVFNLNKALSINDLENLSTDDLVF